MLMTLFHRIQSLKFPTFADYLVKLDMNDDLWNEYVEWKTQPVWGEKFEVLRERSKMDARCGICIQMHNLREKWRQEQKTNNGSTRS